jgi:hypothetical protein
VPTGRGKHWPSDLGLVNIARANDGYRFMDDAGPSRLRRTL